MIYNIIDISSHLLAKMDAFGEIFDVLEKKIKEALKAKRLGKTQKSKEILA